MLVRQTTGRSFQWNDHCSCQCLSPTICPDVWLSAEPCVLQNFRRRPLDGELGATWTSVIVIQHKPNTNITSSTNLTRHKHHVQHKRDTTQTQTSHPAQTWHDTNITSSTNVTRHKHKHHIQHKPDMTQTSHPAQTWHDTRVTQKLTLIYQLGSILCHSGSSSCFSQMRIEIVHTATDTAITSAMWNIAHASTKQNYIV